MYDHLVATTFFPMGMTSYVTGQVPAAAYKAVLRRISPITPGDPLNHKPQLGYLHGAANLKNLSSIRVENLIQRRDQLVSSSPCSYIAFELQGRKLYLTHRHKTVVAVDLDATTTHVCGPSATNPTFQI